MKGGSTAAASTAAAAPCSQGPARRTARAHAASTLAFLAGFLNCANNTITNLETFLQDSILLQLNEKHRNCQFSLKFTFEELLKVH